MALHQVINFGLLLVKTVLFPSGFLWTGTICWKCWGRRAIVFWCQSRFMCLACLGPGITLFLPWDLLHLTLNEVSLSDIFFFLSLRKTYQSPAQKNASKPAKNSRQVIVSALFCLCLNWLKDYLLNAHHNTHGNSQREGTSWSRASSQPCSSSQDRINKAWFLTAH